MDAPPSFSHVRTRNRPRVTFKGVGLYSVLTVTTGSNLISTERRDIAALFLLTFCLSTLPAYSGMNPTNPGFPRTSVYGVPSDNNRMSALCVDCHTLAPLHSDNTSKGTHFVYRDTTLAHATRNTGTWERLTAWNATTFSMYGGTDPTAPNRPPGTQGEMICESCHNMVRNSGKDKLLAADNVLSDPSGLCMGCHTAGSFGAHHPMTGDQIYTRGNQLLSTNPVTNGGSAYSTPLDNASYPGTDKMNCRGCHRPHGAQTATGARVLNRGISGGVEGGTVNRSASPEIDRQWDVDPSGINRLLTDSTPLCASCHPQ